MIGILIFLSFVALVFIDHRLTHLKTILQELRELLQEARYSNEHLAQMRKYYEPEPQPPQLPEVVEEPRQESLKDVTADKRARAGREFIMRENDDDPKFFPIKNITLEQAQKIVNSLDAEQPGWDSKFWFPELGMIDPDAAWDFFLPAAARLFPHSVKHGFSGEDLIRK